MGLLVESGRSRFKSVPDTLKSEGYKNTVVQNTLSSVSFRSWLMTRNTSKTIQESWTILELPAMSRDLNSIENP